MVAFIKPIVMLLAASNGGTPRKQLPTQVSQSQGRIEYTPEKVPRTTVFHKLADDFFPGCLRGEQVFYKAVEALELHSLDK